MQTINLDEQLKLNDDTYDYDQDGKPGQKIFSQDHFTGPQLRMFHKTHRGVDLHHTFSVGGWEAGNFHRVVHQGDLVEGPHAWMTQNDIVLTAHRQEPRPHIDCEPGDRLILRGTTYEIVRDTRGYIELVVIP